MAFVTGTSESRYKRPFEDEDGAVRSVAPWDGRSKEEQRVRGIEPPSSVPAPLKKRFYLWERHRQNMPAHGQML